MRAYTELLVKTCHRRGAHAIGGMAAFIPSRRDPEVNEVALTRVRDDKAREARAGYDGAWVAHPDLVPVVDEVFRAVLGTRPHQKERQRDRCGGQARGAPECSGVGRSSNGSWSAKQRQRGAPVPCRLAGWIGRGGDQQFDGRRCNGRDCPVAALAVDPPWREDRGRKTDYPESAADEILTEEMDTLVAAGADRPRLATAGELLDGLFSAEQFPEFLTLTAYEKLVSEAMSYEL